MGVQGQQKLVKKKRKKDVGLGLGYYLKTRVGLLKKGQKRAQLMYMEWARVVVGEGPMVMYMEEGKVREVTGFVRSLK